MITDVRLLSFDVDHIDLYWNVAKGYDPLDYTFRVLRSEAQFGPFMPITASFTDRFHVRDTTVHQMSRRRWYYKVESTHRTTSTVVEWPDGPGVSREARLDLEGMEMARQYRLLLEQATGREVWIFPRRTFGTLCPVCVDPITRQRTKSVCVNCYGTSFVGGYHTPVRAYANIVVVQEGETVTESRKDNRRVAQSNFSNRPELKEGDLVIETENLRWEVAKATAVRKSRAIIRQEATLLEYEAGHVAYKLVINESVSDNVVTPEQRQTLPASIEYAIPGGLT
jgi:hypothetical protein